MCFCYFPAIDLASAVTPEVMIPILANKDIQEKLIPHLPEGESLPKSEDELRKTVQSPQFQQVRGSYFFFVILLTPMHYRWIFFHNLHIYSMAILES